ncbi:3,4-dihydroxy 2-butanone 4-phosphate synthase / GTP cyclohydrolase II [Brevinema andersonii]|uniref:GTP cyclohydrolase-2 n=1 Tax=Brevinema andersonii TaxID=34097 RepID=A0A1I1DP30_BREAD|nr:GTP cyclohydrolase II [Brevinema andersonii]SFB76587.1 3,4-dihydroxy 2-butanone 4-phosphate synthase / GTP cyclohydrolase II [Brevinema andersonii]
MDTIESALSALKLGRPIIIVDDENRENEGDFVIPADILTPEIMNLFITKGKGLVCTPVSKNKAEQLGLTLLSNTDPHMTAFTQSIDMIGSTTGISAFERTATIKKMVSASSQASDFYSPGHVFPLIAKENGVLERRGHTEAVIDLCRICGFSEVGVICEIINADGTMSRLPQLEILSRDLEIPLISIEDLVKYRVENETLITLESLAKLPTEFGDFKIWAFSNAIDNREHIILSKGNIQNKENLLVRIHSECFTGDIMHSLRCDCKEQLHHALQKIQEEGEGLLIYLRQEGRGIGLFNKIKAYAEQEKGFDTIEANHIVGYSDDLRSYEIAYQFLKYFNINSIRLLSNNPKKIEYIKNMKIPVVPIALHSTINEHNKKYLKTKKEKMGHISL